MGQHCHCFKCLYDWYSLIIPPKKPKQCPRCKRYDWNEKPDPMESQK